MMLLSYHDDYCADDDEYGEHVGGDADADVDYDGHGQEIDADADDIPDWLLYDDEHDADDYGYGQEEDNLGSGTR